MKNLVQDDIPREFDITPTRRPAATLSPARLQPSFHLNLIQKLMNVQTTLMTQGQEAELRPI